jgi:hypothetical protein
MNDSDYNDGSALGGSGVEETPLEAGAVGRPPVPWPPIGWRCMRRTGISGRYTGTAILSTILRSERLELRLDVDTRYTADSPVMNKVSGDHFTRVFRPIPPGFGPEVYSHSWIVDSPVVTWARCSATVTGDVRFFSGSRPATTVQIVVNWRLGTPTTATVTFSGGVTDAYVGMTFDSGSFRTLELEVDYCASANVAPLAPSYGTHQHNNHPADLSDRTLTIASVYREAGVDLTFSGGSSVVNDSAPGFATWNVAELHDAMETAFSLYTSTWPNWRLWGLQVGAFDSSTLGGIMFDAPAANQGAGERPDRQGFAVARNHSWFTDLVASPSTQAQYEALRKYLYVWVHEAGHAWNLLHSWNKGRPSALSWMNYDWKYDAINGADTFWARFYMRFDDEELIHMRHGDRKTVIMGGDDWGTGGHLEAPPVAALEAGPGQLLELAVRCKPYVMLMEPVSVELRLRNTTAVPIPVDARLDPRYGTTTIVVSRPDGTWIDYTSVMCMLGDAQTLTLAPAPVDGAPQGPDRYSEQVPLTFGSSGFVFDLPGTYRIKAVYNDGGLTAVSNVATLRVGTPMTREEDRLAADWFTNAVGLTVALGGSMSPHLDPGLDTLREAADQFANNDVGMSAAQVLAAGVGDDFYRRQGDEVVRSHEADPDAALALTEAALQAHKAGGDKTTNLAYRTLVDQRAGLNVAAGRPSQARKELSSLATALSRRGANPNVVADVKAEAESLGSDGRPSAG